MARQALEAGLLDEIGVDLVSVVLGAGTPLFADLCSPPVEFEGPISVVQGIGVTHLRYRVVRRACSARDLAPVPIRRRHRAGT